MPQEFDLFPLSESQENIFPEKFELNSFDVMNIVCEFEDYFDMSIPTRDVWQLHKVADVIDYAKKLGIEP